MLRRLRQSAAFTLVLVGLTTPAVAFNPAGRSKKPKPAVGNAATAESAGPKGEGQSKEALIARYLGIVLAQPGAEFPLERLTQLYRERDGNLDGRIYTITFSVTDSQGNVGTATAKVQVPKNNNGTAVDSGVKYTETGVCP